MEKVFAVDFSLPSHLSQLNLIMCPSFFVHEHYFERAVATSDCTESRKNTMQGMFM
jgi:hypothetical protein